MGMSGRHRKLWFEQPRNWYAAAWFAFGLCAVYGSAIVVHRWG